MEKTLYLLEDDKSICDLVKFSLELAEIDVHCYNTVKDFNAALALFVPKVVLLDIMLPDGNGYDVLTQIKKAYPQVTCIMLSAMGRENDKVKGFNLGADDYIAKPFGVLELTARVNAAFRRIGVTEELAARNVKLNERTMTVTIDGKPASLSNMEFRLLAYLIRHADSVITRDKLLTAVWGYDEGETRTVDIHIARLRKLGVKGIETVFGAGYKFVK